MRSSTDQTESLKQYLQHVFKIHIKAIPSSTKFKGAKIHSPRLKAECDEIAPKLARAYLWQVLLKWDAEDYNRALTIRASGTNQSIEQQLLKKFPPAFAPPGKIIGVPCTVVDVSGRILAWYLPNIISPMRQRLTWLAMQELQTILGKYKYGRSWRMNELYYKPAEECISSLPGSLTMSAGWFQRGKDGLGHDPEISATLKDRPENIGPRRWVTLMRETFQLANAIMGVIHPELYDMGRESLAKIRQVDYLVDMALSWESIFTGIQIISNRETPLHRDSFSAAAWYDLLYTVGSYRNGIFELPGAGAKFRYNSGTMFALGGHLLQHGAERVDGERACIAFYMRENVHSRLKTPSATWMTSSYYNT